MRIGFDDWGFLTVCRPPRRRWYSPVMRITAMENLLQALEDLNRPWWRRVIDRG